MLLDPVLSVSSFSFYKQVPRKSVLATIGYIAYLSLLHGLAVMIFLYLHARPFIQETVEWAATSMPTLTLSEGKLSSNLQQAVLVRHPKIPQIALAIDTNRVSAVTPQEMKDNRILGYVTQNAIYLLSRNKMESHDLSQASAPKPLVIDSNFYRTFGAIVHKALYPIAFITIWFLFLLWKHAAALIYSLLALLINAALSTGLEYSSLYKFSIYAQTPIILLQMAALFVPVALPFLLKLVVSTAIVGVYLWQAIRQSNPDPTAI